MAQTASEWEGNIVDRHCQLRNYYVQTHELTDTLSLPLLLHLSLSFTHSLTPSASPLSPHLHTLSSHPPCLYKEFTKYANWQTNAQLAQPKSSCNNNTNNNNTDNNYSTDNNNKICNYAAWLRSLSIACSLHAPLAPLVNTHTHTTKSLQASSTLASAGSASAGAEVELSQSPSP